jgi:ubiquinone biosynthesis monooxygenase Coq7
MKTFVCRRNFSNEKKKIDSLVKSSLTLKPYFVEMKQEMRSNHAGELGAVFIYKGAKKALDMKKILKNDPMYIFVETHLQTENYHLEIMEQLVDKSERTKLQTLWKISGFALGFIPLYIFGQTGLYTTIRSVETFVERHYQKQIKLLNSHLQTPNYKDLQIILNEFCSDEVLHKDDANSRIRPPSNVLMKVLVKVWGWIVEYGSQGAVVIAKRI